MTTLTLPPGSPGAADRGQRRRRGGAGLSLRSPGLPPGAHSPHRGFPAEGGRELPEAGRSRGLLHRCGHGLPRGARARGAVCAGQAGRRELPGAERTGSVLRPQLPEFKVTGPRGGVSSRTSSLLMGLSGPGGLDYLVLNHLGATPAGTRSRSIQGTRWLLQVNLLSYVQLTSLALPSLTDSRGSLVVVSSLLGRVPTSFSSPYSAAKFALDGFFGSLRRELDVQDVNVAITMCVLGLRDRASAAEAVRGVTRAKAAPGPKAALAVIRGGATRAPGVFYPWRFHLLGLLRGWLPHPRAWFIRQELNVTAVAAAAA
ncbi:hydroxysteroid 11-beta-dehydrogenase 1-like protein isoform X4 [Canis lupus familiaris]|uniref:hydroxysteroid 11-beta-dehydrogenase 1-like protein isoform X4 n=1 Tax=Canis lupus familiaris TaxID=9615 RepID=UPI0018F6F265|nr:hydroxysteroid 11-beta-dehydrogenase 1-like protein isoform X4 [Canis lupus familiaris]XP_038423575.1 hydroxysteroid 11-beta-dehydrogenase 1-like protein isoform X4 [Canis lupus familiaris]